MNVDFRENFFDESNYTYVRDYSRAATYTWGESDLVNTPPTGMIHNIPEDEPIHELLRGTLEQTFPFVKDLKLIRMYINCFAPQENPYFHEDGPSGVTFILYLNDRWDPQAGGETQFFIDGNIYGIAPVANRILLFPANVLHRATTLRHEHRFTIAIKYE